MMPIISSSYTFSTNLDGTRHVVERHFDGTNEYMFCWTAALGVDVQAAMDARVPSINDSLAAAEFEVLVNG